MYLDPLGENDKKKKSILQSWKTFINRRFSAGLESSGPSKWKIETAQHCKQLDSVSCGVYVMKVGRSSSEYECNQLVTELSIVFHAEFKD